MGLYFLEYGVPPRPIRVLYDRRDSAFARLTAGEVDWALFFAGLEEARLLWGLEGAPEQMVEALAGRAPKATVTLLMGDAGSITVDGGHLMRPSRRHAVQVVDPIGAGDAFLAGFLWAALRGGTSQEMVDAGSAVGALKCSIWGDIALVSRRDVEELLAGGPQVRR